MNMNKLVQDARNDAINKFSNLVRSYVYNAMNCSVTEWGTPLLTKEQKDQILSDIAAEKAIQSIKDEVAAAALMHIQSKQFINRLKEDVINHAYGKIKFELMEELGDKLLEQLKDKARSSKAYQNIINGGESHE